MTETTKPASSKSTLVRIPRSTYEALQLSLPFVHRRTTQEVLGLLIEDYLRALAESDLGFTRALQGLQESTALRDGVLARRGVRRDRLHA